MSMVVDSYRFAAAGGVTTITDSFDRANSATTLGNADTGETWSALAGTWGISSNTAYSVSGGGDDIAVLDVGSNDMTLEVTISTASGSGIGFVVRCTDVNNLYLLGPDGTMYKKVSGTYTQLGAAGGQSVFVNGDVVVFQVIGDTLIYKRNGTTVVTRVDASITTGTKAGLRTNSLSTRWNDLTLVEE